MKDIIRKILKEEFNPEEFDWVNTNLEPIKDDGHRLDLIEDAIKSVKQYEGWKIHQERMDGVVYWNGPEDWYGMATPEWNEPFEIPIDISRHDDYDNVTVIKTPEFKYVIELQNWYKNNYFKLVYKCLTDYIEGNEVPGLINTR